MREFLLRSGCMTFAEGHASAFGAAIAQSRLEELKKYIATEL